MNQQSIIEQARCTAGKLYAGDGVRHRSCATAVAETFGLNTRPFAVLRRGGFTGEGECGAIRAGELVLSDLLAPDDPAGEVDALRAAIEDYRRLCPERIERGEVLSVICNDLTGQFTEFQSPERKHLCTNLAAEVAGLVAEVALKHGAPVSVAPMPAA